MANDTQVSDGPLSSATGAPVVYALLTIAYTWPLIANIASVLPNDTGDPGLIAWGLWWNAHATPFTASWWDAPIFYPARGMLALSETFLGVAPLATPLFWFGLDAVVVHNVVFVASMFLCALAAHALVHELTGRHDVALFAGLAFGLNPYRASQLPHVHLLAAFWMPFALFALHRYLRTTRWGWLAAFGVCWLLNALTTGYYLVFFAVLLGLWLLWFGRSWGQRIAIAVAAALASLPLLPVIATYQRVQASLGLARATDEISSFSADLTAWLTTSSRVWLPQHWSWPSRPEGELYPGLVVCALAVAGAFVATRQPLVPLRTRRWLAWAAVLAFAAAAVSAWLGGFWFRVLGLEISLTRPLRIATAGGWLGLAALLLSPHLVAAWRRQSAGAFYLLAAGAMALLALGPVGMVDGRPFLSPAPYAWLMALPGGDALRVPARFGMLVALCLSVAGAVAAARVWPGRVPRGLALALAVGIVADGWVPQLPVARVAAPVNLSGFTADTAVLELPMRSLYSDTAAMLRATRHERPLANGFSGYAPPHYATLVEGLREGDGSVITALARFSPVAVLVNKDDDAEGVHEAFVSAAPGAALVRRTAVGPIYRFGRVGTLEPTPTNAGASLRYRLTKASAHGDRESALLDNDLRTAWSTGRPQQAGDGFTIELDGASVVSRVELDLGAAHLDYPRQLRVAARLGGGDPVLVWSGGGAGPAVLAILTDRLRAGMVIDLPPETVADTLEVTTSRGSETYPWTVASLRVFGPEGSGP